MPSRMAPAIFTSRGGTLMNQEQLEAHQGEPSATLQRLFQPSIFCPRLPHCSAVPTSPHARRIEVRRGTSRPSIAIAQRVFGPGSPSTVSRVPVQSKCAAWNAFTSRMLSMCYHSAMLQNALMAILVKVAPAVGEWLAKKIAKAVDPEPEQEAHPLKFKDVEHIRAQERSAIEATKRSLRVPARATSAKPQPDEDWRDEPTRPGIPSSRRSPPQR